MGMVEGEGRRAKGKRGVGVRKQSRVGMRIDMTPMVDIAFLLVIFFMTTTRFREPQAIGITLPKLGKPKKTKQSNVLVVTIDAQGELTHKIGDDPPAAITMDSLEPLLLAREKENILKQSSGRVWLDSLNRLRVGTLAYDLTLRRIKEDVSKLTVLIQVDPHSRYKTVIAAMDAVNHAQMSRFSVVRLGTLEQ